MSRYWRHDGPCVVTLTPEGLKGEQLAVIIKQFGDARVTIGGKLALEGNELRINSNGGCQQTIDGIGLFISPKPTDYAIMRESEIKNITKPDGSRIWPPTIAPV
jgi:hypothetical protein